MISSMTGYGRAQAQAGGRELTVELRSVNNRYLDCNVKLPRGYLFMEEGIKKKVQGAISRGKVDVYVTMAGAGDKQVQVTLNQSVLESYLAVLRQLRDDCGLRDDVSVTSVSRLPEVLTVEPVQEDQEALAEELFALVDQALVNYNEMRLREGLNLENDILNRLQSIEEMVDLVEDRSPRTVSEYRAKLEKRMQEVLSSTTIDESRILTEAAIFADKTAVDEEIIRLRSHLSQMRFMLDGSEPVGRKLDFLVQEMNREANTIGSKGNDLQIARCVVDIKAEIEKIREQIQNIE